MSRTRISIKELQEKHQVWLSRERKLRANYKREVQEWKRAELKAMAEYCREEQIRTIKAIDLHTLGGCRLC